MRMNLKQKVKQCFQTAGFSISRVQSNNTDFNQYALGYVSAKETIAAASQAKLSVVDYLENLWGQPGNSEIITKTLKESGVFNQNIHNICEIGTGAGLYVEKTIEYCQPTRYESYETDQDWATWLAKTFAITSHAADGKSLACTPTASVDLAISHGVFVYLPFLLTYRYFLEIFRVVKDGGYAVFDILSEDCFEDEIVKSWLKSDQLFPCFLSKEYVVDLFYRNEFALIEEFFNENYGSGQSKYLIFQRKSGNTSE